MSGGTKLFDVIGRYFWLICIGMAAVSYAFSNAGSAADGLSEADLARRRKVLGWFWVLSVVPWLIVGFGQIVGGVPNIRAYFRPRDLNPYVWAFYASILVIYLVSAWWLLFRGGARIAAELHLMQFYGPGISGNVSEFWFKVIAVALLPFFAFWLWMMWTMNVTTP
jgi:hypothetical protein